MSDQDLEDEDEECGAYGPTIQLTPIYRDEEQRVRLLPMLWRGEEPNPAFAKAVCTAAKKSLAQALEEALGKEAVEELRYTARLSGWKGEPGIPEEFELEVESSEAEDETEDEAALVIEATGAPETSAGIVDAIRDAVGKYLADTAGSQGFSWKLEITGYGGG